MLARKLASVAASPALGDAHIRSLLQKLGTLVHRWACRRRKRINGGSFGKDLCGMCAIASAELFRRLEGLRISDLCILVHDTGKYGHCFVGADRYAVDLTAAQFRKPGIAAVDVRPHDKAATVLRAWQPTHKVRSVQQLIELQTELGWPRRMIPRETVEANLDRAKGADATPLRATRKRRRDHVACVSSSRCQGKRQHGKQRRRQRDPQCRAGGDGAPVDPPERN